MRKKKFIDDLELFLDQMIIFVAKEREEKFPESDELNEKIREFSKGMEFAYQNVKNFKKRYYEKDKEMRMLVKRERKPRQPRKRK
jgi:predicted nucleic acid-binding protein